MTKRYKFAKERMPVAAIPGARQKQNAKQVEDPTYGGDTKAGGVDNGALDIDVDGQSLQSIMAGLIVDAQQMAVDELAGPRTTATAYYNGEAFGTEQEGRSQIVISEVRDQVLGLKPSLMRIFTAPDNAVEFIARTEAGVPGAEQATDAVNFVFQKQNPGFMLMNSVLDDGLIRRLGIFKWGWEPCESHGHIDEDLTLDELFELCAREDVTPTKITDNKKDGDDYRATVEYRVDEPDYIRVDSIPPEEFIFDREALSLEDATMVGHARNVSAGELRAMGISEEDIEQHGGTLSSLVFSADKVQRRQNTTAEVGANPRAGIANDMHLYCETYTKIDVDGDGRRELRKICTLGPAFHIVHNKPADHRPFSMYTPIPEAHAMIGFGVADLVMDLQYVKSHLTRGMLDSFALSIYPRTAFIEGMASVEDVLNMEIGAPIRTKGPDAVTPFAHPFTGEKAMGLLEYFDQVGENRTGRDKGAMGLDADSLQSSSPAAVEGALSAAQERVEFLARIFAEQALKPMFYGIYRLLVARKPQNFLVKLRGTYVPINFESWESDYYCSCEVALGTSLPAQKLQRIAGIVAKQEMILQTLGSDNPLVDLSQYRHGLARLAELSGERDVGSYFKAVQPGTQLPPPPPPPPSDAVTIAEGQKDVEKMKAAKEIAVKQAQLELDAKKQAFDQWLAVQRLVSDNQLRRYQIDAQFKAGFTSDQLNADMRAEEAAWGHLMDATKMMRAHQQHEDKMALAHRQLDHQTVGAAADMAHEAGMQANEHDHEAEMQANEPAPAQGE